MIYLIMRLDNYKPDIEKAKQIAIPDKIGKKKKKSEKRARTK